MDQKVSCDYSLTESNVAKLQNTVPPKVVSKNFE